MPLEMPSNVLIFRKLRKNAWRYGVLATNRKRRRGTPGEYMGDFRVGSSDLGYPKFLFLQEVVDLFVHAIAFC